MTKVMKATFVLGLIVLFALTNAGRSDDLSTYGNCSPINNNINAPTVNNCFINKTPPFERPPTIFLYGGMKWKNRPDQISFAVNNGQSERGKYGRMNNISELQLYSVDEGNISLVYSFDQKAIADVYDTSILFNAEVKHFGLVIASCIKYVIPDRGIPMYSLRAFAVHSPHSDVDSAQVNPITADESFKDNGAVCRDQVEKFVKSSRSDKIDFRSELSVENLPYDFKLKEPPRVSFANIPNSRSIVGEWTIQLLFESFSKPDFYRSIAEYSFDGQSYVNINGSMQEIFSTQQFKVPAAFGKKSLYLRYRVYGQTLKPFPFELNIDFSEIARAEEKKQLLYTDNWIDCAYEHGICSFKWMRGLMLAVKEIRFGASPDKLINIVSGESNLTGAEALDTRPHYPPFNSFAGDQLYMQIEFYDGSESEVRSTPMR